MIRAVTFCIVALASIATAAADEVPEKTAEFLVFCNADSAACRTAVVKQDIKDSFSVIADPSAPAKAWCVPVDKSKIPSGPPDSLSADVAAWLRDHPETHGLPTADGIRAALTGLYPSDSQACTQGVSSKALPTTREFVVLCAQDRKRCYSQMSQVDVKEQLRQTFQDPPPSPSYCRPDDVTPPKTEGDMWQNAVLRWLGAHSEVGGPSD